MSHVPVRVTDERIPGRERQLRVELPGLFDAGGTCLYIGANLEMHTGLQMLHDAGYTVTVLEVWPEYVRQLRRAPLLWWVAEVLEQDVRNLAELPPDARWDVVVWYHGPEHLTWAEFAAVLPELERRARRLVVLGAPWGDTRGPGANPYAHHVSFYYEEDWQRLGYTTRTLGPVDEHGGNLLGWKWLET